MGVPISTYLCAEIAVIAVWLFASLAIIAVVTITMTTRSRAGRGRLLLATVLRAGLVLAIATPLAGSLCGGAEQEQVAVAIDRSDSIQLSARIVDRDWAEQETQTGGAVAAFGFGGSSTNLPAAIAAGSAAAGSGQLLLIADGAYDQGDLESAIAGAVSAGTRLITRSSARVGEADSAVLRVSARSQVAAGRPMAIGAEIYSPSPRRARVQIWLGERLAGSGEVELAAGVSAFTVRTEAPMTVGAVVVAAEMLDPRSQSLANDVINKVVEVIEPPPVVVVGEAPALTAALTRQGVTVDQITARQLPANADVLATNAGLILADIPADALSLDQIAALEAAVTDHGLGLAVIGGPNSYAAGEYQDSPLDRLLPVSSDPLRDQESAQIALLLLLDRSTSMGLRGADGERSKLDLARAATIAAIDLVEPGDRVGVMAFSGEAEQIVPLQTLDSEDARASFIDQVAAIRSDGTTDIFRALNAARLALQDDPAQIRHIVLITDGQAHYGEFGALVRAARADAISISTIAIGDDAEIELLQTIAANAGGRFHATAENEDLPAVLTQEAKLAKNFLTVTSAMQPRLSSASALFELIDSGASLPWLQGYVRTRAREQAQVILSSSQGDPILASWLAGNGRVIAWTSDLSGVWSAEWTNWDQFDAFILSLLDQLAAPPASGPRLTARSHGDLAAFELDVTIGADRLPPSEITLQIETAAGLQDVELVAGSPGLYRGYAAIGAGAWPYRLQSDDETIGEGLVAVPYPAELLPSSGGEERLRRISQLTGGSPSGELATGTGNSSGDPTGPLTAAILLLLADTAVRNLRVRPRTALSQLQDRMRSILEIGRPIKGRGQPVPSKNPH